jgi:hypothetical protein
MSFQGTIALYSPMGRRAAERRTQWFIRASQPLMKRNERFQFRAPSRRHIRCCTRIAASSRALSMASSSASATAASRTASSSSAPCWKCVVRVLVRVPLSLADIRRARARFAQRRCRQRVADNSRSQQGQRLRTSTLFLSADRVRRMLCRCKACLSAK